MGRVFDRLRKIFSGAEIPTNDNEAALHLAAAVLLIEVTKSDDRLDEDEILRLRATLQRDWLLNEADLDGLVEFAHDVSDSGALLHEHAALINSSFSSAQKLDLIRSLWQVAGADGHVHDNEELMIRRLAGLLNVPDGELRRCRHWALGP